MEPSRSLQHCDRVSCLVQCFTEATEELVFTLERCSEESAQYCPRSGGWSATQIGLHVALTNEWFAGAFSRTGVTLPFRGESDFDDESWNLDAPPMGVTAPALLVPPVQVSRRDEIERIRTSAIGLSPLLAQLTPEDGAQMCVQVPWSTISLYQLAEWAGGHSLRHLGQMRRVLAEFAVSQRRKARVLAS